MDPIVVLTGVLPFAVVAGAALSLPACLLLLRLYRRSVVTGMDARAGETGGDVAVERVRPERHLQVVEIQSPPSADRTDATIRRAASGPWRVAGVYAISGLAYALVMTAGWLLSTGDYAPPATRVSMLFWSYAWPGTLAVLLVAAYARARRWQVLGAYFGVLAVIAAVARARNPGMGILEPVGFWALSNGAETTLLLTFLVRPIRAVGPLVLAFMVLAAVGAMAALIAMMASERIQQLAVEISVRLDVHPVVMIIAVGGLGVVSFAALGWPLLRWIGRRYQARRVNDQILAIDAMFVLFGVVQSIGFAFEGAAWMLTGPAAIAAHTLTTMVGFRRSAWSGEAPRTLLLLRVFRLGKRSERLFDRLRTHWLAVGPLSLIAGPDLATVAVEPHEFLDFLSGKMGRQFVTGRADLEQRLAGAADTPDPDGRYRIRQFYCRADTWQMAMQRLATSSDAVLMDLRSFSPANQGCRFELGQLLDTVALPRLVLLVDDTTDRRFLEAALQDLWSRLAATSPNRAADTPVVRVFHLRDQGEATLLGLIGHLLRGTA